MRLAPLSLFCAVAACSSAPASDPPSVACGVVVWHRPASSEAHVEIVGAWDGWKRPGISPERRDDGWRVAALDLPPGEHAYAIVEDGTWRTDPHQPMTDLHEGREVSVAVAADCSRPALRIERVETTVDGRATVRASFLASRDHVPLDPASVAAPGLSLVSADPATGAVVLEAPAQKRGKYKYALAARDSSGAAADETIATVWIDRFAGGEPWDPRDAIVYQILVDRFRDAKGALAPPTSPAARAGGTLAGVRSALESGEIEALGVDTIWLSPLYANPAGDYPGNDGRPYSAYHGYWPIDTRGIDPRIASDDELASFMTAAHERGIRVLFDVVPNHVHELHPWRAQHRDWFKDDCICGRPGCDWGEHIRTCWFAPYLPDLDWTQSAVQRAATSDVLWWFDRWDADGIRIDAVPMMPRGATRRIATSVRRRFEHAGNTPYVLGENFTGPGGYDVLRYDLGPYGLDGSFHFPLMWTLREVVAEGRAPMNALDESFRAGEAAWAGSGAVMGLMVGNHDVARFASVSAGQLGGDPWASPPQPIDPRVYAKQRVALGAVLTLPGAPVLYYGDEVGLAGRTDPDCRRVMPSESSLLPAQIETRDLARRVGAARACSRALRRGKLVTIAADDERWVYAREEGDEIVVVALARNPARPAEITLPVAAPPAFVDVVSGRRVDVSNRVLSLDTKPYSVNVYVAAEGACARPRL